MNPFFFAIKEMLLPNPQPATGKASVCLSIQSAWTLATSTVLLSRRIEKK